MDVLAMEQIRAADTQIKRSCLIIHPKRGCYPTISGIVCLQSIITRLRNTDRFLVLNLFILEKPFIVIIGFLQDWIRSEERRVGKESRSRWWRWHQNEEGDRTATCGRV